MLDPRPLRWKKSSYSTGTGQECMEVTSFDDFQSIALRDSKNLDSEIIKLDACAWISFLSQIKTK